jgi:hypothetical protein
MPESLDRTPFLALGLARGGFPRNSQPRSHAWGAQWLQISRHQCQRQVADAAARAEAKAAVERCLVGEENADGDKLGDNGG